MHPYCKKCSIIKADKRRRENLEKQRECQRKYDAKPENKAKLKEKSRKIREKGYYEKWNKNNSDKLREYNEKYSNKAHKITIKEWDACNNYFNNSCAYCGLPIEEHIIKFNGEYRQGNFHKEHVNHEGINDLSNCVPSCKECNSEKHTYKLEEWYNENNPKFSQERLDKIHKWLKEDYKQYIKLDIQKGSDKTNV